jgi:hypothetical protein
VSAVAGGSPTAPVSPPYRDGAVQPGGPPWPRPPVSQAPPRGALSPGVPHDAVPASPPVLRTFPRSLPTRPQQQAVMNALVSIQLNSITDIPVNRHASTTDATFRRCNALYTSTDARVSGTPRLPVRLFWYGYRVSYRVSTVVVDPIMLLCSCSIPAAFVCTAGCISEARESVRLCQTRDGSCQTKWRLVIDESTCEPLALLPFRQ